MKIRILKKRKQKRKKQKNKIKEIGLNFLQVIFKLYFELF